VPRGVEMGGGSGALGPSKRKTKKNINKNFKIYSTVYIKIEKKNFACGAKYSLLGTYFSFHTLPKFLYE
jgi:hypothetical protein